MTRRLLSAAAIGAFASALDGVAGGLRHQGVVARYAAAKTYNEDDLPELIEAAAGKALLLILDGVQDPHNLGACLRSAAAAGVNALPADLLGKFTGALLAHVWG